MKLSRIRHAHIYGFRAHAFKFPDCSSPFNCIKAFFRTVAVSVSLGLGKWDNLQFQLGGSPCPCINQWIVIGGVVENYHLNDSIDEVLHVSSTAFGQNSVRPKSDYVFNVFEIAGLLQGQAYETERIVLL